MLLRAALSQRWRSLFEAEQGSTKPSMVPCSIVGVNKNYGPPNIVEWAKQMSIDPARYFGRSSTAYWAGCM